MDNISELILYISAWNLFVGSGVCLKDEFLENWMNLAAFSPGTAVRFWFVESVELNTYKHMHVLSYTLLAEQSVVND